MGGAGRGGDGSFAEDGCYFLSPSWSLGAGAARHMPRLEMRNWQREIEDSGHKMTRKMQVFPEKKEKKRKKTSGREDRRYLLCWFTSRSSEFLRKKKRKSGKVLPAGGMSDREAAEQRAGSDVTGGRGKKHPKKDIKGGNKGFRIHHDRPSGP